MIININLPVQKIIDVINTVNKETFLEEFFLNWKATTINEKIEKNKNGAVCQNSLT